jgi:hypothetical protein
MANEIDVIGLILQIAIFTVVGLILGILALFQSKIPIMPRKYWKVEIYKNRDDKLPKEQNGKMKGWMVSEGGVQKFRVLCRGISGSWRGVQLDRSVLKTINDDGVLELVEVVPDVFEPSNYEPKNPIITQKTRFVNELLAEIDPESRGVFELKLKDLMSKHSRTSDLNESRWISDNLAAKRAQRNRVAGDMILEKLIPFIVLIAIGFFMYLSYDSLGKSFNNAVVGYQTITNYQTEQIVQACGGKFVQMNTTQPAKPSSPIPFVGG